LLPIDSLIAHIARQAKGLIQKLSPKYTSARAVYRERKALMDGLSRDSLPMLPNASSKCQHQVTLWKRLIAYEKTNPQRLEPPALIKRIVFTFNQCLLSLYRFPEPWVMFANYLVRTTD
jgi:cleavage stimulation factor subunit 3